ncbi:hypothetical protein FSP39_000436 [Pinctada imbricata]|uniref:TBC domain-containing protein kinase-like protein n=1 Tax=Pinctada imbricata TaxID=66713 RepID=A0AA88Y739_PINIB|nr:hypothetical protein FSP39_000436 [Pinctada imbricata]
MTELGKADFGLTTFFAKSHPNDKCGANGLPLTPNSIKVLGRFQRLKAVSHPNLCNYLDVARGKHERLMVVAEHYRHCLRSTAKSGKYTNEELFIELAFGIVSGLAHLDRIGITHRNLSQSNILLDHQGKVKLSEYGMYYMTEDGTSVAFPIGNHKYLAPEALGLGPAVIEDHTDSDATLTVPCGPKTDVWSIGLILMEILSIPYKNGFRLFSADGRCKDLELPVFGENGYSKEYLESDHLSLRSMEEVYYLWRLAGGDLVGALKKEGLTKSKPPIHLLPYYSTNEGEVFGQTRDRAELLDSTVVILSQEQLRQRLSEIDETAYYPLLEDEQSQVTSSLPTSPSSNDLSETANLPLVIREKDIEYQFHRIILYERLLKGYPYTRGHIWKEARVDIPPLVRAHVWGALLEIEGDIYARYDEIDKETPTQTDRQIEVDIPRCHQYHELLSSPAAHGKFKRVLKAWVVSHPQYVYWQGLDSLCAPFLALNFNNEALAYSCLSAFIPKYLHKFFLKDNSAVIQGKLFRLQEYLPVFSHLITFHDPELGNHLDGIGFIPDLYAIPWFLTMYAHVFPLHKIVHLWDTLLLGNSSFPLCIGVAILSQLRSQLLSFGFNECILLFSDMPEIDIQRCVQDSIKIFCNTPKSATYRQHARPPKKAKKEESRPNISYYSRDYNEQPSSELSMEPIPVEELKTEKCPRISAEDLIELGELSGPSHTKSPTKRKQNSKPMLLVIDVRNQEDFAKGSIPNSINIPFPTAFSPEGDLNPCSAVTSLNLHKVQVKVVVGSRGRNATNFAIELVRLGYQKVCVLHKGIDVLRSTNILTVPPVDL